MALHRRRLILTVAVALFWLLWWHTNDNKRNTSRVERPGSGVEKQIHNTPQPQAVVPKLSKSDNVPDVERFPVSSFIPLPTGVPVEIPRIQHAFDTRDNDLATISLSRQAAVQAAFVHSWAGYKQYAWKKDDLLPLLGGSRTTLGGWGATLVDSLDTLWIMGLKDDFELAVNAVKEIDFQHTETLPINVFETTIRYLGGLLGAYDVSGSAYPVLLQKALAVGDMLYEAFDTPNRMPVTRWNKLGVEVAAGDTLIAEVGSLSLEFTRLSQLSGDPKYFDAIQRISDHLHAQQMETKIPGLWPMKVNAREADFRSNVVFTLGASSDSVYEYLPKEHLLLGGRSTQYLEMYEKALLAMKTHLFFQNLTPQNSDILLSGSVRVFPTGDIELDPKMQHLTCFAGGMVALGARILVDEQGLTVARKLVDGCIWASTSTATGIMPEEFHAVPCPDPVTSDCVWNETLWGTDMIRRNSYGDSAGDKALPLTTRTKYKSRRLRLPKGISAIGSRHYLLRPELIESIFVLYRITGDESLREVAWTLFENIVTYCKTSVAFASMTDVTTHAAPKDQIRIDKMDSYWMAETLKYFYLLYSEPEVISLDEYVFNTEAHPLRRPT